MSDCWKAYACLEDEGFEHLSVNHSLTFKDPDTGAHTNSIEGTWGAIKKMIKGKKRVKVKNEDGEDMGRGLEGYLAEYIWRRCHKEGDGRTVFGEFIKAIRNVYPPLGRDPEIAPPSTVQA
ncbi:protein tssc4-like isoform x1 protein [Lasius niger]|uniref:Protein tssc4-like isoform x1 protein n=1 Tax=Lasius niger TaxID=67767 RepID=A0A0J7JX91_LASNI|nr:protein tssc4-like isoform x1 protein [Lasius niger]